MNKPMLIWLVASALPVAVSAHPGSAQKLDLDQGVDIAEIREAAVEYAVPRSIEAGYVVAQDPNAAKPAEINGYVGARTVHLFVSEDRISGFVGPNTVSLTLISADEMKGTVGAYSGGFTFSDNKGWLGGRPIGMTITGNQILGYDGGREIRLTLSGDEITGMIGPMSLDLKMSGPVDPKRVAFSVVALLPI